jgi:2-polyprenyl-3-methyl-5-hydroxy-6-metoxy-1,4-benzoquinol methylase
VNDYFESSHAYWRQIYFDDALLPTIYQDRHSTALDWIRELGLRTDARILEIGCGAGLLSIDLARNGHTVDAMDSTAAMLLMTRRNAVSRGVHDRMRLHLADVHALSFAAQTFDLVIAIGVIPWLHSEQIALQEIHRVLKHKGYLLVTADNNARLNRILDPLSCPVFAPLRKTAKHLLRLWGSPSRNSGFQTKRHYPGEVNRLIASCYLKKIKSCTVGFGPFTFFSKRLLNDAIGIKLHRRLQLLASRKGFSPLRWTGSHYVVLAAKP